METLPEGFVYVGSDLPDEAVSVQGRTVAFILFHSSSFTYVVSAPDREGAHTFSGVVKDQTRQERPVTGSNTVRVGLPVTSQPTVPSTPAATAVPTRPPESRPTMETTPPVQTAQPTPTLAPTATAVRPTRVPTAKMAPTATATPGSTPLPGLAAGSSRSDGADPPHPTTPDSMDGIPTWPITAIVGGVAVLSAIALAVIYLLTRRVSFNRWR